MLCLQVSAFAYGESDNFRRVTADSTGVALSSEFESFIETFISKKGDSERLNALNAYLGKGRAPETEPEIEMNDQILKAIMIGLDSDQYKSAAIKAIFSRAVFPSKIRQTTLLAILSGYKTEQRRQEAVRIVKDYDGVEAFELTNLVKVLKQFESDQFKFAALRAIGNRNGIVKLDSDSIVSVLHSFSDASYRGSAFDFLTH